MPPKYQRDEDWMFIWAYNAWWRFGEADVFVKKLPREAPVNATRLARFHERNTMGDRGPFHHLPTPQKSEQAPQMAASLGHGPYWLEEDDEQIFDVVDDLDDAGS